MTIPFPLNYICFPVCWWLWCLIFALPLFSDKLYSISLRKCFPVLKEQKTESDCRAEENSMPKPSHQSTDLGSAWGALWNNLEWAKKDSLQGLNLTITQRHHFIFRPGGGEGGETPLRITSKLESRVESCFWQYKHIYRLLSNCDIQRDVEYYFSRVCKKLMKCTALQVHLDKSRHYKPGHCGAVPVLLSTSYGLLWRADSFLVPMFIRHGN